MKFIKGLFYTVIFLTMISYIARTIDNLYEGLFMRNVLTEQAKNCEPLG